MHGGGKGDDARAEILEAAKRLFFRKGYAGTSMRDIAREAGGRAVAGIYNHFPTKQAIFEALLAAHNPYPQIVAALEAGEGDTAPAYISSVIRRVIPTMLQYYDFIDLIQIDMREFEGRGFATIMQEALLPRVFAIVSRIQALPGLREYEPHVLLRLFASTVAGYILTRRLAPTPLLAHPDEDTWIDIYVNMLLYGIADRR
jgi:AcrR family transcriptional regulator